jgi:CheY-like chemotaxis protein
MDSQPARKTIVVVEDNDAISDLLIEVLGAEPSYRIMAERNGAHALEVIRSTMPSLVLLYVILLGMDGLQIYDRLQADPHTHHVPVLFCTVANTDKRFRERGFSNFVAKPFDLEELLTRVSEACGAA